MAFSHVCDTNLLDKPAFNFPTTAAGAAADVGSKQNWHTPGYCVRAIDGREFRFSTWTCGAGAAAAVAGAPAVYVLHTTSTVNFKVTPTVGDATASSAMKVGAFISPVTNGTSTDTWYCWIQTKGVLVKAPCSGNQAEVTAKMPLKALATANGVWSYGIIGTDHIAAYALENGANGYADIMLAAV